jgi:peptidoglycan/xylan/chitin deacetylase (PgdA/CDA1 family)
MTTLTNEQIVAELKWNELAIKEVTGVSPRYFRPPYGDIDNRVREVAAALGFVPVIWNHDTNDWAFASNSKGFQAHWIDGNATEWAKKAKSAAVGGVSLEHDLYQTTVDAAIRVLPILQKEYEIVPVGACNHGQVYKEIVKKKKTKNATNSAAAAPQDTPMVVVAEAEKSSASRSYAWLLASSVSALVLSFFYL